jgi:hypothetical protein
MKCLQTENFIEQIIQGRTSKKRKTCNEEREQRITNLVLRLKNAEINIIEFLRGISYNLSFFFFYLTFHLLMNYLFYDFLYF